MGERTRAAIVSSLGRGAAESAPTSPHATPRSRKKGAQRSGPERFWDPRRWRFVFVGMLLASLFVHSWLAPWSFVPKGFEVRDVEGDTVIPIDLLDPDPPEPPPVEQQMGEKEKDIDPAGGSAGDAAIARSGLTDAGLDASAAFLTDAGADVVDAASDATDASDASDAAPRDPLVMVGDVGKLQAGEALVRLLINANEIKKHPIGAQMGPLLSSIPQWDEFISGTGIDPINQTDWVLISGPGLVDTTNDVIIVHYSAPDAIVDKAIDVISKKYDRGGPFDAGVPGVKAALGHADKAPRVFLRPQSHVLAVVPVHYANTAAQILVRSRVAPKVTPGEAVNLSVKRPYQPFPEIPKTVTEMRLWVLPRADGSAEVFAEGDCATDAEAVDAADQIRTLLGRYKGNMVVKLLTRGLLDSLEVKPVGKKVTVHLDATQEQLEAMLSLVEGQVRARKGPAPPPPPPPAPSAAPPSSAKKP